MSISIIVNPYLDSFKKRKKESDEHQKMLLIMLLILQEKVAISNTLRVSLKLCNSPVYTACMQEKLVHREQVKTSFNYI